MGKPRPARFGLARCRTYHQGMAHDRLPLYNNNLRHILCIQSCHWYYSCPYHTFQVDKSSRKHLLPLWHQSLFQTCQEDRHEDKPQQECPDHLNLPTHTDRMGMLCLQSHRSNNVLPHTVCMQLIEWTGRRGYQGFHSSIYRGNQNQGYLREEHFQIFRADKACDRSRQGRSSPLHRKSTHPLRSFGLHLHCRVSRDCKILGMPLQAMFFPSRYHTFQLGTCFYNQRLSNSGQINFPNAQGSMV